MDYDDLVESIVELNEYLRKFNNDLIPLEILDLKLKEFEKNIRKTEKQKKKYRYF